MFLKKNFVRLLGPTLSIIIAEHTVKAKISVGQPLANFKVDICGLPYNMVTCLIQLDTVIFLSYAQYVMYSTHCLVPAAQLMYNE